MNTSSIPYFIKEKDLGRCSELMKYFWALVRMTYENDGSQRYFDDLVWRSDAFVKKFRDNALALNLATAYINAQSEKAKSIRAAKVR